MSTTGKILAIFGGVATLAVGTWFFLTRDRMIKDIVPDALPAAPPSPSYPLGKTGYKRIDAILGALRSAAQSYGAPLGLLVGWLARESGGKLAVFKQPGLADTFKGERGYFQLTPEESKGVGVDHERLSVDSDYSIDAGMRLIQKYQALVDKLNVAARGSSYYWKLVKLTHSMGSGQVPKIVKAAKEAGQASSWEQLKSFALGMSINGPQPKKWFPFVDDIYRIGYPFGFGSESSFVGFSQLIDTSSGFDLLGAEEA